MTETYAPPVRPATQLDGAPTHLNGAPVNGAGVEHPFDALGATHAPTQLGAQTATHAPTQTEDARRWIQMGERLTNGFAWVLLWLGSLVCVGALAVSYRHQYDWITAATSDGRGHGDGLLVWVWPALMDATVLIVSLVALVRALGNYRIWMHQVVILLASAATVAINLAAAHVTDYTAIGPLAAYGGPPLAYVMLVEIMLSYLRDRIREAKAGGELPPSEFQFVRWLLSWVFAPVRSCRVVYQMVVNDLSYGQARTYARGKEGWLLSWWRLTARRRAANREERRRREERELEQLERERRLNENILRKEKGFAVDAEFRPAPDAPKQRTQKQRPAPARPRATQRTAPAATHSAPTQLAPTQLDSVSASPVDATGVDAPTQLDATGTDAPHPVGSRDPRDASFRKINILHEGEQSGDLSKAEIVDRLYGIYRELYSTSQPVLSDREIAHALGVAIREDGEPYSDGAARNYVIALKKRLADDLGVDLRTR